MKVGNRSRVCGRGLLGGSTELAFICSRGRRRKNLSSSGFEPRNRLDVEPCNVGEGKVRGCFVVGSVLVFWFLARSQVHKLFVLGTVGCTDDGKMACCSLFQERGAEASSIRC